MDTPDLPPTSACVDPGSASSSGLRTTEGPEITVGVHGGEAAALVPAGIKEYVRLLGGCKLRCWIMLMWLILTLSGLSVYFPLTLVLDIAIEPPFGSASERAKDLYEEHYPAGEPVFLAAMLSTTAPHKLFNTDARPYPVGYPPFLDYNPGEGADLIKEAEGIFDDVIDVLKPYLEENGGRCQWNIYNFFSWEVLVPPCVCALGRRGTRGAVRGETVGRLAVGGGLCCHDGANHLPARPRRARGHAPGALGLVRRPPHLQGVRLQARAVLRADRAGPQGLGALPRRPQPQQHQHDLRLAPKPLDGPC